MPSSNLPMRIFGPWRSTSTPTARPRLARERRARARRACGARRPCRARNSCARRRARPRSCARASSRRSTRVRAWRRSWCGEGCRSSGCPVGVGEVRCRRNARQPGSGLAARGRRLYDAAARCSRISIAGSFLPSRNSRNAPPPVEMYEILVGYAELRDGGERVAAAGDRKRLRPGDRFARSSSCRRRTGRTRTRRPARSRRSSRLALMSSASCAAACGPMSRIRSSGLTSVDRYAVRSRLRRRDRLAHDDVGREAALPRRALSSCR